MAGIMDTIGPAQNVGALSSSSGGGTTIGKLIHSLTQKNVVPTHFLILYFDWRKVGEPGSEARKSFVKIQSYIRNEFFAQVNNVKFSHNLGYEDTLSVTWHSCNSRSSHLYYANTGCGDDAVRVLTRKLLNQAVLNICRFMTMELADAPFQLSYITTKNLSQSVRLGDDGDAIRDDAAEAIDTGARLLHAPAAESAPAAAAAAAAASSPSAASASMSD